MSRDVQLELWLHQYKMDALSSVLEAQGSSVEKRMQEMLIDLYAVLVPAETQQEIRPRIDAEYAAAQAAEEAARQYTAFRVRENSGDSFFQLDQREDFLDVAKFLRRYLRDEQGPAGTALQNSFAGLAAVTAEQYDQLMELRMENPNKITGVFDLDFNKQEVSTVDAAAGWKTYSMKNATSAVYHACRKSCLRPDQYEFRFLDKLDGKELTSAGHLSAKNISLAEDIAPPERPVM